MHELHDIIDAGVTGKHTIRVVFEDGLVQEVNLEPILHGEVFGPLRDPAVFAQMRLDAEVHTIVWPNGADFDPETLYHWDEYKDELIAQAESWRVVRS